MTENTTVGVALDNEALDKLEALARAATPGPWHAPGMGEIHMESHDSVAEICFPHEHADEDEKFNSEANPATILALIRIAKSQSSDKTRTALQCIYDTFKRDLDSGYKTKDKEFAVAVAGEALSPNFAARGAEPAATPCTYCGRNDGGHDNAYPHPRAAAGMQAVGQSIDTPEFRQRFSYMLRGEYADLVAHIDAQLSAARQGQGLVGAPVAWIATDLDGRADVGITKDIAKKRAGESCTEFIPLFDLGGASQPTAAPTPQAQPASAPIGFISRATLAKLQGSDLVIDEHVMLWHADNPPSRAIIPVYLAKQHAPTPHEQEARAAVPDGLNDDDRDKLVSSIQELSGLATGTINALGTDNLLKPGKPKAATMADVKRMLPYVVSKLRAVVGKLDGAPSADQAGMLPVAQTDNTQELPPKTALQGWQSAIDILAASAVGLEGETMHAQSKN